MNGAGPRRPSGATLARMTGALGMRPDLWPVALATVVRLAAPGWWRRRPFLPLPAGRLWAFRMETAYGRADVDPDVPDVITFLEWCRDGDRRHRRSGSDRDEGPVTGRLGSTGPG